MVINGSAFKNILVFKHSNLIGTLWSNIGEISVEKGVRKYQLWKKNGDEYELIKSITNLTLIAQILIQN